MSTYTDQHSTSAVTPSLLSKHSRASACARGSEHSGAAVRDMGCARLPMRRWLASRRRVTGVVLAAAGWAATVVAVIAGRPLVRGEAVQIIFAATMNVFALGQTLVSPALPVVIDDQVPPAAANRYKRLGTVALVTGCILGPPVGGAVLGTDWETSLLATVAVACAVASIADRQVRAVRPAPRTGFRRPHAASGRPRGDGPQPTAHRSRTVVGSR